MRSWTVDEFEGGARGKVGAQVDHVSGRRESRLHEAEWGSVRVRLPAEPAAQCVPSQEAGNERDGAVQG
jgi:hypothetical protein